MNIGGEFEYASCEPGKWTMGITGFGETLPYHDNQVTLDKTKKHKWGLPVLAITTATFPTKRRQSLGHVLINQFAKNSPSY
jgi:hypothetical protein